jgi:hypothetical protein
MNIGDKNFWDVTTEEHYLIHAIATRAGALGLKHNVKALYLETSMDVIAAHKTAGLDLAGLLDADDENFAHDVWGIREHMDRRTGQLEGCFLPRYAREEAS